MKWYRKSAEQGSAIAQSNLGWMYQNGRGVRQSNNEAVVWYRKSWSKGMLGASSTLATCTKKVLVFGGATPKQ